MAISVVIEIGWTARKSKLHASLVQKRHFGVAKKAKETEDIRD